MDIEETIEERSQTADELTLEEAFERFRLSGPYICAPDDERDGAASAA